MTGARWLGIVLLAVVPILATQSVAYFRGGFDSAFFRLPVADRLDRIADHDRIWLAIGMAWLLMLTITVAGVGGAAAVVAGRGARPAAATALAVFLVSSAGWLIGTACEMTLIVAARRRSQEGEQLAEALWWVIYVTEGVYVLGGNLAYVVLGGAIVASGALAPWIGWTLVVVGGTTITGVVASRKGFPQLALLGPVILGVGLLV